MFLVYTTFIHDRPYIGIQCVCVWWEKWCWCVWYHVPNPPTQYTIPPQTWRKTHIFFRIEPQFSWLPANSTCSLGKWSNASCSPLPCPEDPNVANLDHNSTLCEDTPHGSSCKVVCEDKYLSDVPEAICTFGEWNEIKCEIPPSSGGSVGIIAGVAGGLGFLLLLLCCLLLFFFLRKRRKPHANPDTLGTVELSIQAQETIQI